MNKIKYKHWILDNYAPCAYAWYDRPRVGVVMGYTKKGNIKLYNGMQTLIFNKAGICVNRISKPHPNYGTQKRHFLVDLNS